MDATVKPSELSEDQKKLISSPYGFGRYFLGLPISDQAERKKVAECRDGETLHYEIFENDGQKRVVDDLDPHGAKVSVRTCNGAGKTTIIIPTCALWFMSVHPRAKVVITSGVDRQVRDQIFPALHAHQRRLGGWRFMDTHIEAPNGSKCVGFTTREGGHFEGWHGNKDEFYDLLQHDGPLMIVVDEAKSVQQQIFDAIERCTFQRLLQASSCGPAMGAFYDSFNKNARFFRTHQLPAGLCPHADHAKNLELIQRRGINDPLVQSKVFAEFMGTEVGAVIQLAWLGRCSDRVIQYQDGARRYYLDFARGGDENVIAEARGNRTRIVKAWREKDTMRACGEFIRLFRELGLSQQHVQECVWGDNGGLGAVVIDRLHELGWYVQRDDAGAAADDVDRYLNHGAETWGDGATALEKGQWILPDDETLHAQLVSRKSKVRSDGRLALESKEDMAKRGIGSPDRADAILGVMRVPKNFKPVPFGGSNHDGRDLSLLDRMTEESGVSQEIAGATCE